MKKNFINLSLLAGLAIGATACQQDDSRAAHDGDASMNLRNGMGAIAFRAGFPNVTPVKKVNFLIEPVNPTDPRQVAKDITVDLNHNLALPGGLPDFNNNPLDEDSRHRFADLHEHVFPGDYKVTVTPLDAAGNPIPECAGASTNNPLTAIEGLVTEKFLMMNCRGMDPAGLDIIAAINHEPEGLGIEFVRETELTHSKFTCEGELEICVTAHDIDNDPLRFELTTDNSACTITESLTPTPNPPIDPPCTELATCYIVSCPGYVGKTDLVARVYDQAWSDNELIDIEEWLKGPSQISGQPIESHTAYSFHGYFMDEDKCEPCPECEPLRQNQFSYVLLQDLSDSVKDRLPTIKADVKKLAEGLKGQVDSDINTKCPLDNTSWEIFPNGGVASFIDRPVEPFGTANDYVYKVHQKSRFLNMDTSSDYMLNRSSVINAFQGLTTVDGADDSEAQLQALFAVLGNYDADKYSEIDKTTGNPTNGVENDFYFVDPDIDDGYLSLAIVITSSPFHEDPHCVTEGSCDKPNDGSPFMANNEDYPVMNDVIEKLKERKVVPVFLVMKSQGAFQTGPYDDFVSKRGAGLVIPYTPGTTDIQSTITDMVTKHIIDNEAVCQP